MDTIHDLGGTEGFGPIPNQYDDDAVLFAEEWKARIWALAMLSMSKLSEEQTGWTLDWYRHVLERLPPHLYLQLDYFEKWILAMMVTSVDRTSGCSSATSTFSPGSFSRSTKRKRPSNRLK